MIELLLIILIIVIIAIHTNKLYDVMAEASDLVWVIFQIIKGLAIMAFWAVTYFGGLAAGTGLIYLALKYLP